MIARKQFLVRCRKNGIFPTHISNSFRCVFSLIEENSPFLRELNKNINIFKRKILNIEIKQTFYKIKTLNTHLAALKDEIVNLLPNHISQPFITSQHNFYQQNLQRKISTTKKKFNKIMQTAALSSSTSLPKVNAKAVHNATTKTLPLETEIMFSLGHKFALPITNIKDVPFQHIIADVESILKTNTDTTIREQNRCSIANIILNYIHGFKNIIAHHDPLTTFCKRAVSKTKEFLKNNEDIIAIKSDKGNKTVVMYKDDYHNKMLTLISDSRTYTPIARDPTSKFQTINNNFAKRLKALGLIDQHTVRKLSTHSAMCPRIYGAPKAHKANLPLRPVVPNMTAPSYEFSKYIGKILQKAIRGKHNIKDSFTFCSYINTVILPPGYILVSLDVTSLFTNISQSLVTHTIINNWDLIQPHTNINLDLFLEILNFCMESSYFKYDNKYYLQIFGTAMGNPLSPTLADLVMETLMDYTTQKLKFKPPLLLKYVDDLIAAIPPSELQHTLSIFNSFDPHIQFTHELEANGKIPFLDMLLIRDGQNIRTEWYMKPIASGRFLDYNSFHPLHQKINTAKAFVRRVFKLSPNVSHNEIKKVIDKQLAINHYPKSLRNRLANRMNEHSLSTNTEENETDNQNKNDIAYRSVPYIPSLTQRIVGCLKQDYPSIAIAAKIQKSARGLFSNTKDRIPTENRSNVIYRINCESCDLNYVGCTSNQLKTRIAGHRSNINCLNKLINEGAPDDIINQYKEKTALLQHMIEQNHKFDLNNVKVIDQHNNPSALAVLETYHIATNKTVNKRSDTDNLSSSYARILRLLNKHTYAHNVRQLSTQNTSDQQSEQLSLVS